MGISYQILYLRDTWTLHDLERSSICPMEIADGEPSISIIDSDDFRNETLNGGGTARHCNWMFLQKENRLARNDRREANDNEPMVGRRDMSRTLTERASEMQVVTPYRTIQRGEPPIRTETPTSSSGTAIQRKRNVTHTLVRVDENGDRRDIAQQKIPAYNGFQTSLKMSQGKSKAYFHMSYNQPPNKSVVNDVMHKLSVIITAKNMPFAFLAGGRPVYIIISTLKAENITKYQNIVPFLGPFHTQCVMMNAIYKRYKIVGWKTYL